MLSRKISKGDQYRRVYERDAQEVSVVDLGRQGSTTLSTPSPDLFVAPRSLS